MAKTAHIQYVWLVLQTGISIHGHKRDVCTMSDVIDVIGLSHNEELSKHACLGFIVRLVLILRLYQPLKSQHRFHEKSFH